MTGFPLQDVWLSRTLRMFLRCAGLLQGNEDEMLDEIGFMDIGLANWTLDSESTEAGGNLPLRYCVHLSRHCKD